MQTKWESMLYLMRERILKIKKGDICHINSDIYDVTVDDVIINNLEFENRKNTSNGCRIVINTREGQIEEQFGRFRLETYNVDMMVDFYKSELNDAEEFSNYVNHLHRWIYLVMADSSTTINAFWKEMYSKAPMMKYAWELTSKKPPKAFKMEISLGNFQIREDVYKMF